VQDLATAAGYSLYHFIRVFNQYVGLTPYDYLIRRRLSEAARDLLSGEKKVVDLAMDYLFESHEGFTRAFSRMFNLTPSGWRERGVLDSRMLLPCLGEDYLLAMGANGFPTPEIKALSSHRLAGWMMPLDEAGSKGAGQHEGALAALRAVCRENTRRGWWQVRIFPTEQGMPEMVFWGVDWPPAKNPPAGFAEYLLEGGTCFFYSEDQVRERSSALLTYTTQGFLPKSGYGLGAPMVLEHHCPGLSIYLPVVKLGRAA
jgi:AraC-like DNA-binding protein